MSWHSLSARKLREALAFMVFRLAMLVVLLSLGGILLFVLIHGLGALSW